MKLLVRSFEGRLFVISDAQCSNSNSKCHTDYPIKINKKTVEIDSKRLCASGRLVEPGVCVTTQKMGKFLGKQEKSSFYGQFLSDKKISVKNSPFSPS